jgi:hypothetical protein
MFAAKPETAGMRGNAERGVGRAAGNLAGMVAGIRFKNGSWRGAAHERVERRGV